MPPHELLIKLRNHGIVQAEVLHDHYKLYKCDHLRRNAAVLVNCLKAEWMQMDR